MSTEANKAAARRFFEVFEAILHTGNFAPLDELFAANYVNYLPGAPAPLDRQAWEQAITLFRTAFPDLQLTVEEMIAEGDTVASRFTMRGTHQGEFQGIAPTGKPVSIPCHVFARYANGKVVEDRPIFDRLDLLQQLGAMPASGQATQAAGA
jgi:steroid delta-isomerase-like uncharacterized protein